MEKTKKVSKADNASILLEASALVCRVAKDLPSPEDGKVDPLVVAALVKKAEAEVPKKNKAVIIAMANEMLASASLLADGIHVSELAKMMHTMGHPDVGGVEMVAVDPTHKHPVKKVETDKTVSPFYHLVVDKETNLVLHIALAAAFSPAIGREFVKEGLMEKFISLNDELSDKEHAMGWCPDPNCERDGFTGDEQESN